MIKHQIEEAIAKAVADFRRDYPNNKGFTRKCVLNMETMVNLLLSMQGGSLKKELYDAGIDVTASAFVQQRNKLSWTVFEDAFEHFNANCNDVRHTYTTNLLTNGAQPKDVQELLGHSDVSTTMNVYAHATREAKRNSARLLDKVVGQ